MIMIKLLKYLICTLWCSVFPDLQLYSQRPSALHMDFGSFISVEYDRSQ